MHKKLFFILLATMFTTRLYSGNPLSLRIDFITGVWLDKEIKLSEERAAAAMPAVITDYGSSQAPISMMGFVLSDHMSDSSKKNTTSSMMVRVDQASLFASNDGSSIDYTHENISLTIDQKIFSGNNELVSRTVKTTGALRVTAGGVFLEPTGNLHFTLPACKGRAAATYDVALSGQVVPFSLPL